MAFREILARKIGGVPSEKLARLMAERLKKGEVTVTPGETAEVVVDLLQKAVRCGLAWRGQEPQGSLDSPQSYDGQWQRTFRELVTQGLRDGQLPSGFINDQCLQWADYVGNCVGSLVEGSRLESLLVASSLASTFVKEIGRLGGAFVLVERQPPVWSADPDLPEFEDDIVDLQA